MDPRITALLTKGWRGHDTTKMLADHVAADPKIVGLVDAEITRLSAVPKGRCYASEKQLRVLTAMMAKHRATAGAA